MMKSRRGSRLLAILLAFVLVAGMAPGGVFGEEVGVGEGGQSVGDPATDGVTESEQDGFGELGEPVEPGEPGEPEVTEPAGFLQPMADSLPDISGPGDWLSARGNPQNMGVLNALTPTTATETNLKWARTFGTGGFADTPNSPVIIGDHLIVSANNVICKLDRETGNVVAQTTMVAAPSFGISSLAYGAGMVFAPISNGRIQAFNASTLESLWVSEQIGGQSLSPIVYHDGYVYTGFWQSETADNYYVCLSVTDEDPADPTETKLAQWKHLAAGGYYWAGGIVLGDYIVFGSDNGVGTGEEAGLSNVFALNRITGDVSDVLEGVFGDQRSGIAYDDVTGNLFFVSKAGYINTVKFDESTGKFDKSSFKMNRPFNAQATSTPAVYDGTVFFGTGGGPGSPGKIVAVEAETLDLIDDVDLIAYPQGSPLLTTAYEDEDKLFLYITYNGLPGGLAMVEFDTDTRELTKTEIFTPPAGMQNYAISSVVCDKDGTLYFHNDSRTMFAIERNVAWLESLSADIGTFDRDFETGVLTYELVVPIGTEDVGLSFTASVGSTVEVNGTANVAGVATIELADGTAKAVIKVANGGQNRDYTVNIREASDETGLGVSINLLNAAPADASFVPFDEDNNYSHSLVDETTFRRVWLKRADVRANVVATAVRGVAASMGGAALAPGTELTNMNTLTSGVGATYLRYNIYFAGSLANAVIKLTVTAEDGVTTEEFFVTVSRPGDPDPPVSEVKVFLQEDDRGFLIADTEFSVEADLSERYGFADTYNGEEVTVLDVLVAAHIAIYGDVEADIQDVLAVSGGNVTKLFGYSDASSFTFLVNGAFTKDDDGWGMLIVDSTVEDGDIVSFLLRDDEFGWGGLMNQYTWFEQDGVPVSSVTADAGSDLTLKLQGVWLMMLFEDEEDQKKAAGPIEDADIYDLEISDGGGFKVATRDDKLAETDEDGEFNVSFDMPGTYYITATDGNSYETLIIPWLEVVVAAGEPDPDPDSMGTDISLRPVHTILTKDNPSIVIDADILPDDLSGLVAIDWFIDGAEAWGAGEDEPLITLEQSPDRRSATVTVTEEGLKADGIYRIRARYSTARSQVFRQATATVEVLSENSGEAAFGILGTAFTFNKAMVAGVRVPIRMEGMNTAANGVQARLVKQDGTPYVEGENLWNIKAEISKDDPRVIELSEKTPFATKNVKNVRSRLQILPAGADEETGWITSTSSSSGNTFTLTVSETWPKVTLRLSRALSRAFPSVPAELTAATPVGIGEVREVGLDAFAANTLEYNAATWELKLANDWSGMPNNGKVALRTSGAGYVDIEGYRRMEVGQGTRTAKNMPTLNVTVAAVSALPKLKLNKTSYPILTDEQVANAGGHFDGAGREAVMTLISTDKKVPFAIIPEITKVEIADKGTRANGKDELTAWHIEGNRIGLSAKAGVRAGTAAVEVYFENAPNPRVLQFRITTPQLSALKTTNKAGTVNMNRNHILLESTPVFRVADIPIAMNVDNLVLDDWDIMFATPVTGSNFRTLPWNGELDGFGSWDGAVYAESVDGENALRIMANQSQLNKLVAAHNAAASGNEKRNLRYTLRIGSKKLNDALGRAPGKELTFNTTLNIVKAAPTFTISLSKARIDISNPESVQTATVRLVGTTSQISGIRLFEREFGRDGKKNVLIKAGNDESLDFVVENIRGLSFDIKRAPDVLVPPTVAKRLSVEVTLANGQVLTSYAESLTNMGEPRLDIGGNPIFSEPNNRTVNINPRQTVGRAAFSRNNVTLYGDKAMQGEGIALDLITPDNVKLGAVGIDPASLRPFAIDEDGLRDGFRLERKGENEWTIFFANDRLPIRGDSRGRPTAATLANNYKIGLQLWAEGTYEWQMESDGVTLVRDKSGNPVPVALKNAKGKNVSKPIVVNVTVRIVRG